MGAFLEQYGIAIFVLVIVGVMVLAGSGLGHTVESLVTQEIKRFTDKSVSENNKVLGGNTEEEKPGSVLITGMNFNAKIPFTTTSIEFLNTAAPDSATIDVSEAQDGSIMAWIDGNIFKVAPKEAGHIIYANPDSRDMFLGASWEMAESCCNVQSINFSNFNTSKVINMSSMFQGTGYSETSFNIDVSNWDVSNVTNMYSMFCMAGRDAITWSIGDISSWDVYNVIDMEHMFTEAGKNASYTLDLSSWKNKISNIENYKNFDKSVEDKVISPWD